MPCFKNAREINEVSLQDRAFHYGDGCFTTARVRHGKMELENLHKSRLQLSCERLMLQADLSCIEKTLAVLQQQFLQVNGTLKIIISRGEGQRGYSLPDHPADVWVFFYPKAVDDFQIEKIKSGVLQQALGLSMPNLVGLKSLNRLEQVLLKHEADQRGWAEALVTDVQGTVVEGVSSNCFIRLNNTWVTPELRYNGVHGVMRAEILSRMQQHGIQCEQRFIDLDDIAKFESLFFCNALSPMKVVTELNQHALNVQPCIELFNILQLDQIH
ncbi:aminodeoxychorismate lyase [Acinetobacter sp. ANC 4216]|uniref:aminodeoxychorismate lyase n=1 Tax=unclassified Acinetobacter TaxID=196816 RepID=UPI00103ADC44|nr:aminodeoxychorismate lyase [Acinetobacter sp. ANC 4216]TCB71312.1 aminodeoxychorismate lyase [Acinetobacter sp. ANC 4216]